MSEVFIIDFENLVGKGELPSKGNPSANATRARFVGILRQLVSRLPQDVDLPTTKCDHGEHQRCCSCGHFVSKCCSHPIPRHKGVISPGETLKASEAVVVLVGESSQSSSRLRADEEQNVFPRKEVYDACRSAGVPAVWVKTNRGRDHADLACVQIARALTSKLGAVHVVTHDSSPRVCGAGQNPFVLYLRNSPEAKWFVWNKSGLSGVSHKLTARGKAKQELHSRVVQIEVPDEIVIGRGTLTDLILLDLPELIGRDPDPEELHATLRSAFKAVGLVGAQLDRRFTTEPATKGQLARLIRDKWGLQDERAAHTVEQVLAGLQAPEGLQRTAQRSGTPNGVAGG